MGISSDETAAVLIDELEAVLQDLAPTEAVSSSEYVLQPEAFRAAIRDRPLSFPGAEVLTLIGPVVLNLILQVALDFVGEAGKPALRRLAKTAVGYLAKTIGRAPRNPRPEKNDALRELNDALMAAGWQSDEAMRKAVVVWDAGIRVGERLVRAPG
jgi:hypothetical protein